MFYIFNEVTKKRPLYKWFAPIPTIVTRYEQATVITLELPLNIGPAKAEHLRRKAVQRAVEQGIRQGVLPPDWEGLGVKPIKAHQVYHRLIVQGVESWAKGNREVSVCLCCHKPGAAAEQSLMELAERYRYVRIKAKDDRGLGKKLYDTYGVSQQAVPGNIPTLCVALQRDVRLASGEVLYMDGGKTGDKQGVYAIRAMETQAASPLFQVDGVDRQNLIAALLLENSITNREITLDIGQV